MDMSQRDNNQKALDLLRAVQSQHPGATLKAVVATKTSFIINGAFDPGELDGVDHLGLAGIFDGLTQEQAASMDMRGAAETEYILEIQDANTSEKLWPGEADVVFGKPSFCPHCGKETLKADLGAFVEQGEYDGKRYASEGDTEGYTCTSCGKGFLDWTICDASRKAIRESLGEVEA